MALLTAREAARYLHISLFTLGRIEKEGLLVPFRTPGGHRRYRQEMLDRYLEGSRSQRAHDEPRILVVDEGGQIIGGLASALPDCRFTLAQDELHVGFKLAEFRPDLVLVNEDMRGTNAQELCRKLSAQSPAVKALSFHRLEGDERDAGSSAGDASLLDGLCTNIVAALGLDHKGDAG
jgi:excisionase family DNA binding protein